MLDAIKKKIKQATSETKLIDRTSKPNSVVQLIGFVLIVAGVIYLLGKLVHPFGWWSDPFEGDRVALIFFIIMMGVAFAFPDLLQDDTGGLSTMRIVVFMMVNVICILMLKIGWPAKSFADIGINSYWVGIVAFVFGSKATQSYFESKMAVAPAATNPISFSQADIAKLAVSQHAESLMVKFPNIQSVSDTVNDLSNSNTHVVAIYLKDDVVAGIPDSLSVTIPGQPPQTIQTEIIKNVGNGIAQAADINIITDVNDISYKGSVCCMVKSDTDDFFGFVTAGHIYSKGMYENYNAVFSDADTCNVMLDNNVVGKWYFQMMNLTQDIAVIKRTEIIPKPTIKSFSKGYYQVTDKSVKNDTGGVIIQSKRGTLQPGYILDYNTSFNVQYGGGIVRLLRNIILVGSTKDRTTSKSLSVGGDSGSSVFLPTGELLGILVGGNDKYSFVLPIQSTLDSLNLKPI